MQASRGRRWADGIVLSVTGLPKEDRGALRTLVESQGGLYSTTLSKHTTHLVVATTGGAASDKLHAAKLLTAQQRWALQLVSVWWLLDSAERGTRLDEAQYPPPTEERTPLAARPASAVSRRRRQCRCRNAELHACGC